MKMMYGMLMALTPAALWSIYAFGPQALVRILAGVIAAVAAEAIFQKLTRQKITVKDGSAAVTGLLLGLAVSISTPWYAVSVSAVFGIIAGKQLLGGFGKNLFNPAMYGRLFYLFVFPDSILPWRQPFDLSTAATPLEILRETGEAAGVPILDMFLGRIPGTLGEISSLLGSLSWSIASLCVGVYQQPRSQWFWLWLLRQDTTPCSTSLPVVLW